MRRIVICAILFLAALPAFAGQGGGHGSGGRGGGYGVSSGRGYNSGHGSGRSGYDGRRWQRGAPSWGVGSGGGSGIDPDTMDAVNARIRGLKTAAAKAGASPACHTLGCGNGK